MIAEILNTAEEYLEGSLVRMISMRVPMFTDLGLYLVGSLIICVRLRASSLDCRMAGVLSMSQFRSPNSTNSEDRWRAINSHMKCIYKALLTSCDFTKCCTETQPKTPNSKQCRCRSTVARKNSLERPEPRKKPREEPGSEGWPVLFWLCRVEIMFKCS